MTEPPPLTSRLSVRLFLILLLVALVGVSSAVIVRWQLIEDFRALREGEREDRIYALIADIEHEIAAGTSRVDRLAELVARGLSAGIEVVIVDGRGSRVLDTPSAMALIDPKRRDAIRSLTGGWKPPEGGYESYPLFVGGNEVGRIDVRFFTDPREGLFARRSLTILGISAGTLLFLAFLLSLLAAGRLSRPLKRLADLAAGIADRRERTPAPLEGGWEIVEVARAFNRMNDTLHQEEQLRKKLFANAAHELRTPLASMRCELEGVLEGVFPLDRRLPESLLEEVKRLSRLVGGLEELARAESSILSLQQTVVDLSSFLDEFVESVAPLAREQGVEIGADIPAHISITADPDRLSQILINLVSNALRATPPGGRVTLSVERSGDQTILAVTDTGSGIDPADLPHLFERFYRGPGGGMGIGLAIVRELVEAHGWSIGVESAPGRGSRFFLTMISRTEPKPEEVRR
ncbi:MAG: ATP-binding protein [Desulfuromonadia bacterium]